MSKNFDVPEVNQVITLIREGVRITAVFADGRSIAWCDCKTERGAKCRLSYHAKRLGFVVCGDFARSQGGSA